MLNSELTPNASRYNIGNPRKVEIWILREQFTIAAKTITLFRHCLSSSIFLIALDKIYITEKKKAYTFKTHSKIEKGRKGERRLGVTRRSHMDCLCRNNNGFRSDGAATEQEEKTEHGNESHRFKRRHDSPHQLVDNGHAHHPRPP